MLSGWFAETWMWNKGVDKNYYINQTTACTRQKIILGDAQYFDMEGIFVDEGRGEKTF